MATYVPPTYGIVLAYPTWSNPVTLSGSVTNIGTGYSGDAVFGTSVTAWTVTNYGTITGNSTSGNGVELASGGDVINAVTVRPSISYPGIISGYANGVLINAASGTVSNAGTIEATGANGVGVSLQAGGTVANSGTSGLISGDTDAIYINGGSGTVSNLGTIASAAGNAVRLAGGGSIGNSGLISATGYGVFLGGAVVNDGTVVNSGTITSLNDAHWGVALTVGGSVTNQSNGYIYGGVFVNGGTVRTVVNYGSIARPNGDGVDLAAGFVDNSGEISGSVGVSDYSGVGTVLNTGTVIGTGTANDGVDLLAGGNVSNAAATALISGYMHGIYVGGSGGSVANYGTIEGSSYAAVSIVTGVVTNYGTISALGTAHAGVAVQNSVGTVVNLGVIQGSGGGSGIHLHAGGSISNGSAGVTTASITGGYNGVKVTGSSGTVNNYATIAATGASGLGVYLAAGGTVTNTGPITGGFAGVKLETGGIVSNGLTSLSAATISGAKYGVWAETAAATVGNYGTIAGTGTDGDGLFLYAGGTVTNDAGGLITGVSDGVCIGGSAGTVVNSGSITGSGTGALGVMFSAGGSVTNASAGVIDAGAAGVSFKQVAGTVVNYGAIFGTAGDGIYLGQGGTVTNGAGSAAAAAITGLYEGIRIDHALGAVNNYGIILATAATGSPAAVDLLAGGSVINRLTGSISGLGFGVSITYTLGAVTNYGTITASGAYSAGVYLGAGGTVTNYGTIAGNDGVRLAQGGTVVNKAGALLSGADRGVDIGGTSGAGSVANYGMIAGGSDGIVLGAVGNTVTNSGTITGAARFGVFLTAGGNVTNTASGVINAYKGIFATYAVATITNLGTITGAGANGVGVEFGLAGSTLTNAGTIIGDPTGAAVRFTSGGNRLIVDPGAVFSGGVYGGGGVGDVLELAAGASAGTVSGLGTTLSGFDNVTVDSLAAWLLSGATTLTSGTALWNFGTLEIAASLTVGGTFIDDGVIDIEAAATLAMANGASGVGSLVFAGAGGTLEIDGTTMPATSVVISGFTPGETIHLRDIAGGNAGRPVPGASNLLTVVEGGTSFPLQFDPTQSFGGFEVVGDGASGTDLLALPHLTVSAGRTTVSAGQAYIGATVSGGVLRVASNGSVYGTQIGSAGSETISSGGFDSGTVIVGGGRQTVLAGGVADGTVLDAAAVQDVFGSASGTVISAGDAQRVESGGVATSTTVSSGGSEVVSAGGTAIGSHVFSGGTETVRAGGSDSGATLSGGLQDLFGTAAGVAVYDGGRQLVESGGVANNTVISGSIAGSGGTLELAAGGVESGTLIFSGVGGDLKIDGGAAIPTGPISDFVYGDTIDLPGLVFTSGLSASFSSGTLGVTSGGTVIDQFAMSGIRDGQAFVLTSDGAGGTAIGRAAPTIAYMTGATDPWSVGAGNSGSPDAAMDTAFGAGNWTKIQGFSASALTAGYQFIYLDGGDGDSAEFDTFIASNITALQDYVAQGGRLFINAARWVNGASGGAPATDTNFNVGFGVTLVGANYAPTGTALQVTNPIFTGYNGPTGSSWSGNWFSHDFVVGSNGVSLTPLISGTNGAGSAGISLAGEHYGGGYVMFGGITSPSFQTPQPQADLLRANILDYVAGVTGTVTSVSLFDFIFTYQDGKDYYIGTVADDGTFGYTAGKMIVTATGQYDIFNKESGTTAQAAGTVHVLDYSHSGPGVASPIPVMTATGQADGTAGLGSESDTVQGTDGTQHAFSSTVEPSFPMAGLFGFVFTYADGAAYYSGTVVAAPGVTPAIPGSSLGTYTLFAEGVTAQLAGTVVIDRFTESPASFVPNGAGGAAGTGGLGSEAGSLSVNGTTYNFSDNLEPVIPLGVVTVPVVPAPPTADVIATQVTQIFNQVLGRNPSSTELQAESTAVAGGTSLSAIRATLAGSAEAQGDLTQLYSQIFARAATAGELATDTGQLAGGSSLQTVQFALAQSPEAQTDLQTIYNDVLARTPNGNELATFIGQLGDEQPTAPADPNGRPGLAGVRDIVAHSPEAQADLNQLFQGVILRAPAAAELVGMEDQLANPGNTQQTLTLALQGLGSPAAGYATIAAGPGGATLTAQAGTPTLFDFTNLAFGADTIVGFDPSRDTIELPVSLAANLAAVQADLSATTPATITLGATQFIQLSGVAPASLGAANFLFK